MVKNGGSGNLVRVGVIVLVALTTAFMLLGGIGTSCVAFGAGSKLPPFRSLQSMIWLYQVATVVTIAVALPGLWATVGLLRSKAWAYRWLLISLGVGLLFAGAQMFASNALRGKSAPNNIRVYITAFTIVVLLLIRRQTWWDRFGFGRPSSAGLKGAAGGLAMFVGGLFIMSAPMWAGPSHMVDGFNEAATMNWQLLAVGGPLTLAGLGWLILTALDRSPLLLRRPQSLSSSQTSR